LTEEVIMKKVIAVCLLLGLMAASVLFAGGAAESAAASSGRGRYLAGQGVIIPPEEVRVDSSIASIDYHYPDPEGDVGVTLHSGNQQYSTAGQEGVLHIGIQGARKPYADLPPMNLAFVIDKSSSMSEDQKLDWVKQAFDIFINQVRDKDFVSLVIFDDEAQVLFPSTQMKSPERRRQFQEAVQKIYPSGGSNLQAGLELGYQQVLANFRSDYVNRVLFLSDGTEMSARLRGAGAKSGDVRVSLMWNNINDLDLHVIDPAGEEIFYGRKKSRSLGELDVDMNVSDFTTKPVENVYWPLGKAPSGHYRVFVQFYTDRERRPSPFTVEVLNKGEVSTFEGVARYRGERVPVCEFDLGSDAARQKELYTLDGLARQYKELGIGVSTIGVGVGFDLELMDNLARAGGGSSRFIADRREMEETFGTDLDRMLVPGAKDLALNLEFLVPVEILGTWGYNHQISGSKISYSLPTLHTRDYETILVQFRTLPGQQPGRRPLVRLATAYSDLMGKRHVLDPLEFEASFVDLDAPVTGFSDGLVLQSGTMLHYARSLIEIGTLYYACRDELAQAGSLTEKQREEVEADVDRKMQEAVAKTQGMRQELANAKLRLESEAFDDEVGILDKYLEILGRDLSQPPEAIAQAKADLELEPQAEERPVQERLNALFEEISLDLADKKPGTIAVSGFTTRDGKTTGLIALLDEMAVVAIGKVERMKLTERTRLDVILQEQELALSDLMDTSKAIQIGQFLAADYLLTGSVIEMERTVIIFGRIINVQTAEIESVAQVVVPKTTEVRKLF
jgi:Ca-activated chloride channel family protein